MSFNYSIATQNRFLLIFLFLSTLSIVCVYKFTSNGWLTFIVFVTHLIILFIAKSTWNANSVSNIVSIKSRVPLASISAISVMAGSQPKWKSLANSLIVPLSEKVPFFKDILPAHDTLSDEPSILVFIVAVIGIVFLNYFYLKDATAMKEHPIPIDEDFPEKTYKERFISFCNFLSDDLRKIDRETNWSVEYFTPLDAEVEVQSGSKRLKKVTDLLNAIKADRLSRIFLVIGDPGSGKSVSFRKLSRELLQESEETGKVPLYINLREWETQQEWTEDNPPTIEELYQFVVNNLKARGDIFINEFIDKYFKKMFEHGRLFIILDSFDEIPAVMDVSENSWLIDKLSDVIHRFLAGANESRGILASRIFRRPSDKFDAKTILEIRPFTEDQVIETLKKSLSYDDKLVELIFKERQEFVPVARNPFTAALISSYAREYDNSLPQNQAELYSSYIDQRLDACRDRIQRKNLTKEQIIQCAIDIADTMMTTETYGLEASVQELKLILPQHPIEDVIDILKYARLGRLGSGDENRFSFVHRRFNEYFVVQRLIERPHRVPQDAIPNDSRWRDALVLYCEVAEENKAKEIANFCWSEISQVIDNNVDMRDPQFLRMIHCLRFLKEAFRTRLNSIEDFRVDLTLFIIWSLTQQENLLWQKFAVEAVGLLKNEDIDTAIILAIGLKNDWISETAVKSCRHLPKISNKLKDKLIDYIDTLAIDKFMEEKDNLSFSLKLSDGFHEVEKFLQMRVFDDYCYLYASILAFLLFLISLVAVTSYLFKPLQEIENLFLINKNSIFLFLFTFAILVLPKRHILYYAPEFLHSLTVRKIAIFFLQLTTVAIIAFICSSIINIRYFENLSLILADISIAIQILFMGLFQGKQILDSIFYLISHIASNLNDFKTMRKLRKNHMFNIMTREQIAEQFKQYKTNWGRLSYIQFLNTQNIKPVGDWPEGKLPNINNDTASTLLAKLEEKWLGLDR
ncbi:MAG: NACHT domain-containing protein [Dolichospermum sp. UKL201]|nr:MAG: NACHT domain-containing protein [Dolichospermum sp. UKL201]